MIPGINIILNGGFGINIPTIFVKHFSEGWTNISQEDRDILLHGPEHDGYWEAWESVLDTAEHIDKDGYTWRLMEDNDLCSFCEELMNEESYDLGLED